MTSLVLKAFFLGFIGLLAATPQENSVKPVKKTKPLQKEMRGSFGARGEGAGFVFLNGNLFIEAIVIHNGTVESGIFQLDTGIRTGCVMETYFAEKMKIMGLGNVSLKFGAAEIKNVKATVLDHPELQQIFKENTALFQNRPICGVIGYPVLAAKKTVLDFGSFTALFKPLPEKRKEEKKDEPPFNRKKNPAVLMPFRDDLKTMWMDVRLNDKVDGVFQIKTGSPFSWVAKEAAEKAGLRKGKEPRSLKVGESELSPLPIKLRILKVPPPVEKSTPFPMSGCIGTDFLVHFKVTIDPVNKELMLEPVK